MKDRLFDDFPALEMLFHDALEQIRSHSRIPDALRVHHDDRTVLADAKAGRLSTLDPRRTEEEPFPLEEAGEKRIQLPAPSLR